jgi:hypothetical protein
LLDASPPKWEPEKEHQHEHYEGPWCINETEGSTLNKEMPTKDPLGSKIGEGKISMIGLDMQFFVAIQGRGNGKSSVFLQAWAPFLLCDDSCQSWVGVPTRRRAAVPYIMGRLSTTVLKLDVFCHDTHTAVTLRRRLVPKDHSAEARRLRNIPGLSSGTG